MQSILDDRRVVDVVGSTRPLLFLNYEETISSALKKLDDAHVFGAIVNSGPVIVGVIDMKDIVRSLIKFTRAGWKDFSKENAVNLSDEAKMFTQQVVGAILSPDMNIVRVTRSAPVCEAVAKMVDGNVRRLVVVDELGKTVNVITQFDIVKFLFENIHEFGATQHYSVGDLGLGSRPVICASLDECAAAVFHLMIAKNVRSVGIINDRSDDELVANLSLSDLKGLNEKNFQNLSKNVFEFLLDSQETPKPIISCTDSNTFAEVLERMIENKIHRVYVVDEVERPCSVISLVDVLNFAVQCL